MATMKTLNGYGFNAIELNGKTSDSYLQKTDTASDSAKLGGKIPKVYTPHTNLADNSDFEHFVSQTAIGANHGDAPYGGDRWILERGTISGEWDYERNGYRNVTLNGKLVQVVPSPFPSVATPFVNMVSGTATISYDATKGEINIESAGGVIKNVMLLEGDWAEKPEYVSRGYAAELAVCQKYYYFVDHYDYGYIGAGNAFSDTDAWFAVTLPTKMRYTPTVKMPAVYCDNGSGVVKDVNNIYVVGAYANIVYCLGSVNGMFNKGNLLFRLKPQTDAYAAFYADLPRRQ